MIPKQGKNHSFPESYRSICRLPAPSKIAEKIIKNRLEEYIEVK